MANTALGRKRTGMPRPRRVFVAIMDRLREYGIESRECQGRIQVSEFGGPGLTREQMGMVYAISDRYGATVYIRRVTITKSRYAKRTRR